MLDELQRAQNLFEEADNTLTAIVLPVMERFGVTNEKVTECQRQLLTSADG